MVERRHGEKGYVLGVVLKFFSFFLKFLKGLKLLKAIEAF
jgi:hypothetical protein